LPESVDDCIARAPVEHGVYVISDPTDSEPVYVGRTKTAAKGLGQRMWDHRNNNGSADLNQKLGGNKLLAGHHNVRVLAIEDRDLRRIVEHFGIGVLNPKYNK